MPVLRGSEKQKLSYKPVFMGRKRHVHEKEVVEKQIADKKKYGSEQFRAIRARLRKEHVWHMNLRT